MTKKAPTARFRSTGRRGHKRLYCLDFTGLEGDETALLDGTTEVLKIRWEKKVSSDLKQDGRRNNQA
jgi:hypothetical protein